MQYPILAYSPELQAVRGTNNVITLANHLCSGFPVLLPGVGIMNVSASSAGCPFYVRPESDTPIEEKNLVSVQESSAMFLKSYN